MREIKFRAYNQKTKKMFYVDWFMPLVIGDESKWTIHNDANTLEPKEVVSDCDSELMQYTGLKDKNGKEIYEGDIVEFKKDIDQTKTIYLAKDYVGTWFIRWNEECLWFEILGIGDEERISPDVSLWNQGKVIGNIYENPKLAE